MKTIHKRAQNVRRLSTGKDSRFSSIRGRDLSTCPQALLLRLFFSFNKRSNNRGCGYVDNSVLRCLMTVVKFSRFIAAVAVVLCYLLARTLHADKEIPYQVSDSSYGPLNAKIDLFKVMMLESRGNPKAHNMANGEDARGLFQIRKCVVQDWNQAHPKEKISVDKLWNPLVNRRVADWYLHKRIPQMLKSHRKKITVDNVLISWNAGVGKLVRGRVPASTRNYVREYHHGVA